MYIIPMYIEFLATVQPPHRFLGIQQVFKYMSGVHLINFLINIPLFKLFKTWEGKENVMAVRRQEKTRMMWPAP